MPNAEQPSVEDWQETATQLRRVWKLADHEGLPRQVGPNMAERMLALGDALTAALERAERERDEYRDQWNELSSLEFIEYWHTIGYSCTAGTAIKALLARAQKAEEWAEEGDALNESLKERVGEYLARAQKAEAQRDANWREIERWRAAWVKAEAVVEAARTGRDHSVMLQAEPHRMTLVGWRLQDTQALNVALTLVDEPPTGEGDVT